MLCVHMGPGRLGLGLVVDTLLALDLDVCLVGAHGRTSVEVHEHEVQYIDRGEGPQRHRVRWVANSAGVRNLDPGVLSRLASDEAALITGSLAHEAPMFEDFLRELLELRPADAETVVLACENTADRMYAAVTKDFPHVHYCACAVDRVVNWNDPLVDADGRRRIIVHPIAQWVIRHPDVARSTIVSRLQASPVVTVVAEEDLLAGYRRRKQWAVNGVHLVMALITRYEGYDVRPHTAQDAVFDELRARVMPLMAVILQAVETAHPNLPYDRRFVEDRLQVFHQTPNSTMRILEHRLVRADPRALMKHFDVCVGDAAREVHRLGMSCDQFEAVVRLLLDTFDLRSVWIDDWKPADLNPLVDAAVVAEFQASVAGWMDPTSAHGAASRLSRVLALHRNAAP